MDEVAAGNSPYHFIEVMGAPGGHLSHKLLHTTYTPRGRYNELV